MKPIHEDDVSFHDYEQTAQRLPVRDGCEAR